MATPGTKRPVPAGGGTSANTSGGPRPRILRIGVLLGGKIVEERLIRERVPVTIGQSMKNTFSIPIEGLPLEFTLFALDEGKYYLRFLGKMDGRLSDEGSQVQTLDALKQRGASQGSGGHDYWQVPLGDHSRGKLSLGDLTVLFQFVAEPPRAPKPMLPASVRGTFADRIDPRLAVIIGASIVAHFAVVLIAWLNDVNEDGLAERAYHLSFAEDKYQVTTEPEPVPTKDTGSAAGSAAAVAPVKQPDKGTSKPTPDKPTKDPGAGRDATTAPTLSEDDAAALADLVSGEGSNARTEGDMDGRRPGADLGDQIASVRDGGRNVAIGGGSGRGTRGDGGTRVGTSTGTGIGNTGAPVSAGGGKGEEKGPVGRISVSDKQSFDDSDLSPDAVLKKIQSAYMAGIKHCYTSYLKKEATARGKVKLTLTVNQSGRVTDGGAKGFADEVDSCVGGLMRSWTFPKPKDKDGSGTEASFAISLQLVPD